MQTYAVTSNLGRLFQAPVVQRADNSIQRITRYPVDRMYQFRYILSCWIATYPLDRVIHSLNNWGQKDIIKTALKRLTTANFHAKAPGRSVLQLLPEDELTKYLQKYTWWSAVLVRKLIFFLKRWNGLPLGMAIIRGTECNGFILLGVPAPDGLRRKHD